jgi:hypothetical protein
MQAGVLRVGIGPGGELAVAEGVVRVLLYQP